MVSYMREKIRMAAWFFDEEISSVDEQPSWLAANSTPSLQFSSIRDCEYVISKVVHVRQSGQTPKTTPSIMITDDPVRYSSVAIHDNKQVLHMKGH